MPQAVMSMFSRRAECKVGRNQGAFSRKTDWIDIANAGGLQKDLTRGVVLKMNEIRIKDHTAVVVMTKLPNG